MSGFVVDLEGGPTDASFFAFLETINHAITSGVTGTAGVTGTEGVTVTGVGNHRRYSR